MPVSSPLGKGIIEAWLRPKTAQINKIVDVGCGEGTYAKLMPLSFYWIGVEIWKDYIEKYNLKRWYHEIINADIREIELPDADCIIFGDVIEHMPKMDGIFLLERAVKKYKHVIVSIPIGKYEQGAIGGNPYEEHKATWYKDDLISILYPLEVSRVEKYCEECPPDMGIGVFIR